MSEHTRSTGRTFRAALSALLAASEGKRVVFVCIHVREVERVWRATADLACNYSPAIITKVNKYHLTLQGGGSIKFTHKSDARGCIRDKVIYDDW